MIGHRVQSITLASLTPFRETLKAIPLTDEAGRILYLHQIKVRMEFTLTSAATSTAINQDQWWALLPQIQFRDILGRELFRNGALKMAGMREVNRVIGRCGPRDPTAIAADTNTARSVVVRGEIPFRLPRALEVAKDTMFPAAFLGEVEGLTGSFLTGGAYGTGQVVTAATLQIIMDYAPLDDIFVPSDLQFLQLGLSKFDQETLPLNGSVLYLGLVDDAAGATTTIAANDFTHLQVKGKTLRHRQDEDVDLPTELWNDYHGGFGDAHDATLAMPTAGTARQVLIYGPPERAKISDLPSEDTVALTMTVGAGAPAVGDQRAYAVVIRPPNHRRWKALIAQAFQIGVEGMGRLNRAVSTGQARGRTGAAKPSTVMSKLPIVINRRSFGL